jgi:hypothetical protein
VALGYVQYYCAVQVQAGNAINGGWSGRADLVANAGIILSSGAESNRRRVCRYTPVAGCSPSVGDTIWGFANGIASCTAPSPQTSPATPSRAMTNGDHPASYVNVNTALLNQNFLVIQSGNGSAAYSCPDDYAATPFVIGQTRQHQP